MEKKFGNRKDGEKLKNLDGMHYLMIDLKPNRCDSDVYINQKLDVTELIKYVEKIKKKNPEQKITYFHTFAMAIAKVIYNRPYLNRFIAGGNFYQRKEVKLSFVAKVEFEDNAEELLCVLNIFPDDNIFTLSDKIKNKVEDIRNSKKNNSKSNTNNLIDTVGNLPKLIRRLVVGIVKFLDKHGWLPKSMVDDNIYYSSVILSNLGSIHCGAIYHNLTNFGTNSILVTMGEIHQEKFINEAGTEETKDICEFGINLDERIADGFYFVKSVNLLQNILNNPKLLEGKASDKIENK